MPIYQAIVLAIVQGLGEFIPISSSGHLIIVRRLLGWNELSPAHELSFDVALHFGTLLSVLFYFRRTWFQIIRAALGGKVVRFSEAGATDAPLTAEEQKDERMLLWFLAIATIPGAIAGKLLEHSAEDYFREHIFLIAGALIVVAPLPAVRKVMTESGIEDFMPVCRTLEEAAALIMILQRNVTNVRRPTSQPTSPASRRTMISKSAMAAFRETPGFSRSYVSM